jgi:nicotinamidase-related amidase
MTTLPDRTKTALLVVDVQNDVVDGAYRRDEVVANIAALVEKARASDAPVIWIQHSGDDSLVEGTEGWHYVPELPRHESEPLVHKRYGDAFEDTTLESELARRAVGRLVVAGAQTDACVRATIHGAFTRGYDTVLVGDAHTSEDLTEYGAPPTAAVIAHTNLYWRYQEAPGRTASVVDTAAVSFG